MSETCNGEISPYQIVFEFRDIVENLRDMVEAFGRNFGRMTSYEWKSYTGLREKQRSLFYNSCNIKLMVKRY